MIMYHHFGAPQTVSDHDATESRLCAEILESFGPYYIQDQFRNGTTVLQEVEWVKVPFASEVVE